MDTQNTDTDGEESPVEDTKPGAAGWQEGLAKTWDEAEARDESAKEEQAAKPNEEIPEHSAEIAEKAWDSVTGDRDFADLNQLFEPRQRELLAKRGKTPASYMLTLDALGDRLENDPARTLTELAQFYLVNGRQGNHPVQNYFYEGEWNRFCLKNPKARDLRVKIGAELERNPPKRGVSEQQQLAQAYKAITQPQKAATSKKQGKQSKKASTFVESKKVDWHSALNEAIDGA